MAINDMDDFIELASEYASMGTSVHEQIDALRSGKRLPDDELSEDAVKNYIIPFLQRAAEEFRLEFDDLPIGDDGSFEHLGVEEVEVDTFEFTISVSLPKVDEYDGIAVSERVRNALEVEGLTDYKIAGRS